MGGYEVVMFGVGLLSMCIAIAAAISAKGSADAAKDQASEARRSADAAEAQSAAAKAQAVAAQRANKISETALRIERVRLFQNARQLLRETDACVDAAVDACLFDGRPGDGPHHCNTALETLNTLQHMPVDDNLDFDREIAELREMCRSLFFDLQAHDFVIWGKQREIMSEVMRDKNAITERIRSAVEGFDRAIVAGG